MWGGGNERQKKKETIKSIQFQTSHGMNGKTGVPGEQPIICRQNPIDNDQKEKKEPA